jgi:membrane fusion protein (multidrug efflux system)
VTTPAPRAGAEPTPARGTSGGPHGDDLGFDLPPPASISRSRAMLFGLAAFVVLGGAFGYGYLPRRAAQAALVEAAHVGDGALQRVEVVTPKEGSSDRAISLPGSVQPLEETTIYARASGYVRKWYVDIGDKVKGGQLLVEIDTPELDQELDQGRAQLSQAEASLVQSKANRELSQANLQRYKQLAPSGVVSMAELDQRQAMASVDEASVTVAQAAIAAQQANIRRLVQLKGFARVAAPFGGTVTQRTVETGSLVSAGNGQPMYKVAAMDPARIFTQVPQGVAPGVRAGVAATVTVREYPGRTFTGTVTRAAGELDPATRTMNTEIRIPNPDGLLIAGMYAQVAFTLPSPHRVFEIPSTAVASDAHGSRVAVVDDASEIRLVPIVIERDTGATVEVASGLTGTERIAKLASAQFVDGKRVEVAR